MKTIKTVVSALLSCGMFAVAGAQDLAGLSTELLLKKPGNPAVSYKLSPNGNSASGNTVKWTMSGNRELPVVLKQDVSTQGDITTVTLTVTAKETVYYNLGCTYVMNGSAHDDCLFYMPGFWYHKNLRSPKEAPSFHTSDSWVVREDRLSTPLTGIFNAKSGEAYTVLRREDASADCVLQNLSGDVILTGETSLGYTGFRNVDGKSALEFGYPYREAPRRYIRKLTLIDPVRTFAKLDKGDSKSVTWQIRHGKYADYSAFIADVWKYSFDAMNPQLVASAYTDDQAKEIMTNYFKESYVDKYPLKFLSSPTMPVASCDSRPAAEIGFVGRTLLNAFNAIEYGEANNRPDLVEIGKNIFDSGFDFDIDLRLGAGAFVCGEETALMTSIEGNRGEPRPRPPFPAVKGLFASPTILNNVETYANIPQIILNGAEWFASMGTEKSKGTKVFAVNGKINNTGLVEVPMGTTLRTIIEDIGGGIPNGKKFKAAQTGGPSGGCIPAEHMDIPIDYDNLISIGSMMGSGGLIVMDEDTCMVDIAKFFLEFTVDESCGKCTPCRVGTKRLYEMLDKITKGEGTLEDLDKMEELCYYIKDNALCGLGQTAPNPVLSTLRYFRDEYIAHIVDKKCPAGVCKALLSYKIDADKCKGCTLCARNCPNGAISGKLKEPHVIDQSKCLKCGACMEKCRFGAIYKE